MLTALLCLVVLASKWRIFTKAGRAGWLALVPGYNVVVLFQIAERPVWQALAMLGASIAAGGGRLLPFSGGLMILTFAALMAAAGFWFSVCLALAGRFNRGTAFAIGMMLVPWVFFPILAFGSGHYGDERPAVQETLGLT